MYEDAFRVCDVPRHLRDGLDRYLRDRILPGGCLQSVLAADLVAFARRADPITLQALPALVCFLEFYAPPESWGDRDRVLAWTVTPDRLEV